MFRQNKRVKNTIRTIAVLLFSAIFFALAYKGYKKQKIDLSALATITGEVEDSGTDYSGGKVKSRVFFIKFRNLYQALGVYRKDRDYTDLVESVRPGDVLTAYFIPGGEREKNKYRSCSAGKKRSYYPEQRSLWKEATPFNLYRSDGWCGMCCAGLFSI